MTPQESEEFFNRIDLNPEAIDESKLPEGWRISRPSDFTYYGMCGGTSEYEYTFTVEGPWALGSDFQDGDLDEISGETSWGLPDTRNTLLVFRQDEAAEIVRLPRKRTRWPAWDKACGPK